MTANRIADLRILLNQRCASPDSIGERRFN